MATTFAAVEKTYTRTEAAARLGLAPATLARWASRKQRKGPRYSRTGDKCGRVLYRESDLLAWLESRRQGEQ